MRAMILSAGLGARLRPLTDNTPKPLIEVGGVPLIVHHINRLVQSGVKDIVINLSYRGDDIRTTLGDGKQYGVRIHYSHEVEPLESAGGMRLALHRQLLLPNEYFLAVNADIFCDVDFANLQTLPLSFPTKCLLVLVDNPPEKKCGDFLLSADGMLQQIAPQQKHNTLTYSGIGLYHPHLLTDIVAGEKAALLPILQTAIANQTARAIKYHGIWHDAGTLDSLSRANQSAQLLNQK